MNRIPFYELSQHEDGVLHVALRNLIYLFRPPLPLYRLLDKHRLTHDKRRWNDAIMDRLKAQSDFLGSSYLIASAGQWAALRRVLQWAARHLPVHAGKNAVYEAIEILGEVEMRADEVTEDFIDSLQYLGS